MQKREKILAAAFGAVILIWLGMPLINSTFIEPVETRRNKLKALNQQIDQREQKELELLRSTKQLGAWVDNSLPPDEHDAQRLYLEWLNDLAELSGFSNLKLSPGRRMREGKPISRFSLHWKDLPLMLSYVSFCYTSTRPICNRI